MSPLFPSWLLRSPRERTASGTGPRPGWWRRWFGTRSERRAARFLVGCGFRILCRNYTCPHGELDLIALDGDCIVFVEVRSTGDDDVERAALSVDREKQRRLTNLALHFLQQRRLLGRSARFDVVAISWPNGSREPSIVHHRHAFEATGRFQTFN